MLMTDPFGNPAACRQAGGFASRRRRRFALSCLRPNNEPIRPRRDVTARTLERASLARYWLNDPLIGRFAAKPPQIRPIAAQVAGPMYPAGTGTSMVQLNRSD
jgi:hypothetical protein